MKRQPATINYFFGDAYYELWETIKSTFARCGDTIGSSWERFVERFLEMWEDILSVITFDTPFRSFFKAIYHGALFGWATGLFIFNIIITPIICVIFTAIHVITMLIVMLFIYIAFFIVMGIDKIYRSLKSIINGCPNCGRKFSLPIYVCPRCGVEHDKLVPSKYGILKRTCECGYKLPTTALNGRGELESICPHCNNPLAAGTHTETWIPVIGGPNAGKTCFIHMAIAQIERSVAPAYGLEYEYVPNSTEDYATNIAMLDQGVAAVKTEGDRLQYYQFKLQKKKSKVANNISLCDIKGEAYTDAESLKDQIGFKNADAFVVIVDPLSVLAYREEAAEKIDVEMYGSAVAMDEVLGLLLGIIDNMMGKVNGGKLSNAAVVFTKCDFPGLDEKIGRTAVEEYMASHADAGKLDAQNEVCKNFLYEYGEANLIVTLESRFKSVQFFSCSALGHVENGTPFQSDNVEDAVLWLLDKKVASLNFASRWSK